MIVNFIHCDGSKLLSRSGNEMRNAFGSTLSIMSVPSCANFHGERKPVSVKRDAYWCARGEFRPGTRWRYATYLQVHRYLNMGMLLPLPWRISRLAAGLMNAMLLALEPPA
jgi:hypothetical protein